MSQAKTARNELARHYGKQFEKKLASMSDAQAIAIYLRLKNKGILK